MTKQEIIGIINEAVPNIKKEIFGEETDKNIIGCNQFRELANICRHSDCYEEIEMLIRYNEAKIKSKNTSWAAPMVNAGTTFADVIVNCMQKIKCAADNEQQCMKDISMFFGYFYWNARIWAAENKSASSNNSNSRNTGNNYNAPRNNGNNYNNGAQRRRY